MKALHSKLLGRLRKNESETDATNKKSLANAGLFLQEDNLFFASARVLDDKRVPLGLFSVEELVYRQGPLDNFRHTIRFRLIAEDFEFLPRRLAHFEIQAGGCVVFG